MHVVVHYLVYMYLREQTRDITLKSDEGIKNNELMSHYYEQTSAAQ